MNNIFIIGIITVAIIIAVAVLMRMSQKSSQQSSQTSSQTTSQQSSQQSSHQSSQKSSQSSLAVIPPVSTTDQPSSQQSTDRLFVVYSDVNFTGSSLQLPGPGVYPLDPECGTGIVIPFKPKSVKMQDKYRLGFKGWYNNKGDTKCGPSITWTTDPSQFSDLTKAFSNWIYTYVGGSIVIEDKNTKRDRDDRHY
jgi:hypothetical protein